MADVTYSMSVSLDGCIVGPDGGLDWGVPDDELHQFANDEVRDLGVHLMGRRLYETMLYWETAQPDPVRESVQHEFGAIWNRLPKVVFSHSLTSVQGNARLATSDLATEIARLREELPEGNIGIGGAELAGEVAQLGLIDEYRLRVHPVLLGGGTSYFSSGGGRVNLELVDTRTFASKVVFLRYRVVR